MQKIELETRYNRDAWLATAIEVLSKDGQAKLRTEHIAKALGVTRGSFYHHFKNREEFVFALVDFWAHLHRTNERKCGWAGVIGGSSAPLSDAIDPGQSTGQI